MSAPLLKWSGIAGTAIVVAAVAISVTWKSGEDEGESSHERTMAYARARLGGAGLASLAKGGDPDSRASVKMTPGESRGDGAALSPAEELAARKAWPAATVRQDQIEQAQQDFKAIKGRGHRKAPLQWTSIGPMVAFQPGILGFTGRDQVTAGRTTALLVDRTCNQGRCRVWIGAAGGGVWRTDHGMHTNNPGWKFSSDGLGSNAFGSLAQDPSDKKGDTLYAGTGEPNASGDSEAGLGLYKSTDGGDSWTLIPASTAIANTRSIAKIAIDPTDGRIIYIATARGVRGISSTSGGAVSTTGTPQPNFGVYKTTNGGATWSLIWDAQTAGSLRGVTDLEIDPFNRTTIYASAFQLGIYRSQGGGPFQQVFAGQLPASNVDRTEFALAALPGGKTRVYATNGSQGNPYAALFRNDDASLLVQGSPNAALWKKITSDVNGTPYYATFNFCTGQCWYDQDVMTPQGQPDTVFVIGSYTYGELGGRSNARAVLRSTTAGEPDPAHGDRTFTDMTMDAQVPAPYGIHPDQHELAFHPTNPNIWWSTSDGGVVRSSGEYVDITSQCAGRPIGAASMATCNRMLSAVPSKIFSLNEGLITLQFMSVSVNPFDPTGEVQGGTQDNGTWLYDGKAKVWKQTIYGDGGTSGFDVGNPAIRFNQFFGGFGDVNFRSGDPTAWVVVTAPMLNSLEPVGFYWPEIADPAVPGTMYTGFRHVWRTKDNAGNQTFLEANCPEFTTPGNQVGCGDWVALGGPGGTDQSGDLASAKVGYGADRAEGTLARVARAPSDTGTLWAATSTGRLFITKNAAAEPSTAVTFTRLDSLVANDPNRFITGIYVDASNPNRAFVSYSGYNTTAGSTAPGHVFEVTFNPAGPAATWVDWSYDLADLPVTDVAFDDPTGDLYVSTDFGVMRLEGGETSWEVAGDGLPVVETPGLTIVTSSRRLYAATHGMGMWYLRLPSGKHDSEPHH